MEIYCPECEWEPPSSATWTCECGHSWHTFDTHGRCPECGTVWRETQCHECRAWSPHHDWYHDLPPVDVDAVTEGQEASRRNEVSIGRGCVARPGYAGRGRRTDSLQ